jgi:hypothetical protein
VSRDRIVVVVADWLYSLGRGVTGGGIIDVEPTTDAGAAGGEVSRGVEVTGDELAGVYAAPSPATAPVADVLADVLADADADADADGTPKLLVTQICTPSAPIRHPPYHRPRHPRSGLII